MSSGGCPLTRTSGPGRDEVAKRRQHLELNVGFAGEIDQRCAVDVEQHSGSSRAEDARGCGLRGQLLRVEFVEFLPDLMADGLDQGGGSQLAPDVVHVQHEHHDADDDENEGDHDRDARHEFGPVLVAHLAQRQHRVRERAHEGADRELAGLVLQNGRDDARRELPHRELNHHQDHRQHQGGEAHHRTRDRAEDLKRRIRAAGERPWDQPPIECAVQRNADQRQTDAGANADQWPKPHTGLEPVNDAEFGYCDQADDPQRA
jgi:hypothetical protein